MKPKHQRLVFVFISIAVMAAAASIILTTFRDSLVFFFTPTQLMEKLASADFDPAREMRLGGLVETGSVAQTQDGIAFTITDLTHTRRTTYRGLLPTLFREGQGVVATGTLEGDVFVAHEILAKHDENYMPKEVAEALKASGQWKEPGEQFSPGGDDAPATAPPRSLRSGSPIRLRDDSRANHP